MGTYKLNPYTGCPDYFCDNDGALMIHVSKNGSDNNDGSTGFPFLTINAANNYAITLLTPVVDWNEAVVIKVGPGVFTEQITHSHRRIFIVGSGKDYENWPKPTILYNTGADAAHYPIACKEFLNLAEMQIMVDSGGVFGELINRGLFSSCIFDGGAFIEQTTPVDLTTYYNTCAFTGGKGFDLSGTVNATRFIALRNCDAFGTDTLFGSSGTGTKTVKFDKAMMGTDSTTISGNWSLLFYNSEKYDTVGRLIIDTDGFIDIFSSIITVGIHFLSDTAMTKKVVSCLFNNTPVGEGDITGDIPVEFIEYSGNHQYNGIDGEVITVSKIKNVGGGQNKYRNIHEALQGSVLTDTIINLEGDIEVSEPLVINSGIDVQIDGNKKWKLTSTHATTLATLGAGQQLSFVNMKQILGGKTITVNGNGATLSLVSCGRYTQPNYVNIVVAAGDISSLVYIIKTSLIGTAAPVILISDIDPWLIIDRSFLKGAAAEPAIEWTVDADSRFRAKYSTMIHGSGSTNSPLLNSAVGDATISIYNCAMNASFPTNKFTNNIGNPNNTVDPQIDY